MNSGFDDGVDVPAHDIEHDAAHSGLVPARVRVGNQIGQVRWFRVLPRAGEWVNHAPHGWPRDDYEVEWVLHWAWNPDEPSDDRPDVSVEICLINRE